MPEEVGIYARARAEVLNQLQFLKGKTWTSDDMCRWCGLSAHEPSHKTLRDNIIRYIYNISYINKKPLLKQIGNRYQIIERELDVIDWWKEEGDLPEYDITFPFGIEDNTSFNLETGVKLIPGDLVVVAGETNMGKTALLLNIMANNCDKYPTTYFTSEFNKYKFKNRVSGVHWVDLKNGDGLPKFEIVRRTRNFEDAVAERPDNLCIIDWIKMEDDLYKMGYLLGKIKDELHNGILFVAIQKRSYKKVGEGGEGTLERADLYLNLCFKRLEVARVKTPKEFNAEGGIYGFDLVGQSGVQFHNIRPLEMCKRCHGEGRKGGYKCEECEGTGYKEME